MPVLQPDPNGPTEFFGLSSSWSCTLMPFDKGVEGNPPIEGDGNVCAFRIKDGHVDMKTRYVETERLRLERRANKRLFGLYRTPFSHHPCVRPAVDSTAKTNLVYWADKLLALKESALPYQIDPDTLETVTYEPFKSPGKTFSAHPKVDPYTDELVVFGYEAKGLATDDIVIYTLDKWGKVHDEQWIKSPWLAFIHDCAINPNFIILVLWPYDADVERMKAGGGHWMYNKDRPVTFVVVPRRENRANAGWKPGEYRIYHWDHSLLLHTAGAWEEVGSGKIHLESSRMFYSPFPMFDPPSTQPFSNMTADYVRWELDLRQPTNSRVPDPEILLTMPGEMARIDERFLTHTYDRIFCPVVVPGKACPVPPILPPGPNGYMLLEKGSAAKRLFDPGPNCTVDEPVFVPRSTNAAEGDGWLLSMVHRLDANRSDVVVLDTRNFSRPVAVIQLPFRTKAQVHGNWVESGSETKSLVRSYDEIELMRRGALEPEELQYVK